MGFCTAPSGVDVCLKCGAVANFKLTCKSGLKLTLTWTANSPNCVLS